MFGFKKQQQDGFVYDQAVILEIDLEGGNEFATESERSAITQLEQNIDKVLPQRSGIDGHEFGEHTAIIYIYGSLANVIYNSITKVLQTCEFNRITVTLQYGLPDDPETREKKFSF